MVVTIARAGAVLTLIACGTDVPAPLPSGTCAPSQPLAARCGTGVTEFVELHDGDPVTAVFGPQGGWHLWAGVSTHNSGQDVIIVPTITVPSENDLRISAGDAEFVALGYDPETCSGSLAGRQARLDGTVVDEALLCSLDGRTVHLRIDVTDLADERTASCEVDVVFTLDEIERNRCANGA